LRGSFNITAAEGVQVSGNLAYIAFGSCSQMICTGGLEIVDVSDPASPTLHGSLTTTGDARDVQLAGDRAYIAIGNRLLAIDVSDSAAPQEIEHFTTTGGAEGVSIAGGLIFVTGYRTGLQILTTDPELLTSTTTIGADGGQAASVDGHVRFQFAAGAITNPLNMLYLSRLGPPEIGAGASVVRSFVAEARAQNGQAIVQTSQPYGTDHRLHRRAAGGAWCCGG
jgi:hypothetical protein